MCKELRRGVGLPAGRGALTQLLLSLGTVIGARTFDRSNVVSCGVYKVQKVVCRKWDRMNVLQPKIDAAAVDRRAVQSAQYLPSTQSLISISRHSQGKLLEW